MTLNFRRQRRSVYANTQLKSLNGSIAIVSMFAEWREFEGSMAYRFTRCYASLWNLFQSDRNGSFVAFWPFHRTLWKRNRGTRSRFGHNGNATAGRIPPFAMLESEKRLQPKAGMEMAVYYMLNPIECAAANADGDSAPRCTLKPIDAAEARHCANPVVEVITPRQFDELDLLSAVSNDFLHSLVQAESNFVDVYADHMIGSFAVPDKEDLLGDLDAFAFYKDTGHLIFADSTGVAEDTLKSITDIGVIGASTTAHCLYVFMKQLLIDEIAYMAQMEDKMESLEEDMLERHKNVETLTIMQYRRQSMKLSAYYEQIGTMAAILADNENKQMTAEEARSFDNISNFADRLASRGETLESYSLQLHELHETRISLTQNSIMQTLTVVTVIIAPLTLLTGWFGMNVPLPGMNLPYMWAILFGIALVVTLVLVLHFHRRKWLK